MGDVDGARVGVYDGMNVGMDVGSRCLWCFLVAVGLLLVELVDVLFPEEDLVFFLGT